MSKYPLTVKITLAFILINAILWLSFGVIIGANLHPSLPIPQDMKYVLAFLSIGIAILLVAFGLLITRLNRIAYFLGLAFFISAAVITILDNFGITDLLFLLLCVVPIILLIKDRAWYLRKDGV